MTTRTRPFVPQAAFGADAARDADDPGCPSSGWRSQFGRPRGLGGRLAGRLMATKNAAMIATAVDALDLGPEERALEIGFGHGVGVALLAAMTPRGFVAGVDPSEVMVSQATRRNRRLVRDGRVDLRRAGAESIPFPDGAFDAALAVNSFQHWPDAPACLAEVRRVLAPGGRLLLALRLHDPAGGRFQSPGFTPERVERARRRVIEAGFESVAIARRKAGRELALLSAARPS